MLVLILHEKESKKEAREEKNDQLITFFSLLTENNDNINDIIKEFKIPYSHLKLHKEHLNDTSKARIASYKDK